MEIAPGIHRVETPLGDRFVCMYLLVGDDCTLLIDTGIAGMPQDILLPYMAQANLDPGKLRYVLISHIDFDHTGGNSDVRELAPDAIMMCHELDRPMVDDVEAMITGRYSAYNADHGIDETPETKAEMRQLARHVHGYRSTRRRNFAPWSRLAGGDFAHARPFARSHQRPRPAQPHHVNYGCRAVERRLN